MIVNNNFSFPYFNAWILSHALTQCINFFQRIHKQLGMQCDKSENVKFDELIAKKSGRANRLVLLVYERFNKNIAIITSLHFKRTGREKH